MPVTAASSAVAVAIATVVTGAAVVAVGEVAADPAAAAPVVQAVEVADVAEATDAADVVGAGGGHRLRLSYGPRGKPAAKTVVLRCKPPRGAHPHAAQACRDLTRAGGDLDALPDSGGICTAIYAPVTATAAGRWGTRPVKWSKTFANTCRMKHSTARVFTF